MENQNQENRPVVALSADNTALYLTIVKIVITILFVFPLAHYSFYRKGEIPPIDQPNTTTIIEDANISSGDQQEGQQIEKPVKVRKIVIVKRPSCPLAYLQVILMEICDELQVKRMMCLPEDVNNEEKHQIPKTLPRNNTTAIEARSAVVGYLSGGLLVASLGAALLDVYRARRARATVREKAPLQRKCSLADLTVLKHHRKELTNSRRDQQQALDAHQVPVTSRRCSFTMSAPLEGVSLSRQSSLVEASVGGGRRGSVVCRRGSVTACDSPEIPRARRSSRLLTRH